MGISSHTLLHLPDLGPLTEDRATLGASEEMLPVEREDPTTRLRFTAFIALRTANLLQVTLTMRFRAHLDGRIKAVLGEVFVGVQATLLQSTTPIFRPRTQAHTDSFYLSVYRISPSPLDNLQRFIRLAPHRQITTRYFTRLQHHLMFNPKQFKNCVQTYSSLQVEWPSCVETH